MERTKSEGRFPDDRVPLIAAGLELVVSAIVEGPLAGSVRLQVYSAKGPTSVGATVAASEAETLAAAILAAGQRAVAEHGALPGEASPDA
jgi:hypothetical protein